MNSAVLKPMPIASAPPLAGMSGMRLRRFLSPQLAELAATLLRPQPTVDPDAMASSSASFDG